MPYLVHVKSDKFVGAAINKFTPNKVYILHCPKVPEIGTALDDKLILTFLSTKGSMWIPNRGNWKVIKIQEIVSRDKILSLIENSKGKFLCVWFIKKDGTKRRLIGRFGVKVGLKTESTPPTVDTNKYFVLYDTEVKGYRAVNKETIYEVSVGGKNYVVEG